MTRYVIAIIGFGITIAALLVLLFGDAYELPLLLTAAAGTPISVLLLTRAVVAPPPKTRPGVGSFVLGGTVIPVAVVLLGTVITGAVMASIEPLRDTVFDLTPGLRIDSDFVDLLLEGWAFFLLVELAVMAPLLEETLKPLAALVARPRTRSEALLFGASAGAGFAAVENVMYASGWFWNSSWWVPISVVRMTGSALHLLGAALIALAVFELRQPRDERLISLPAAYGLALGVHATWNGSIAVAIVLFAGHDRLGLADGSLGWGTALLVLLGTFGVVILAGLLAAARAVHLDQPLRSAVSMTSIGQAEGIAAWALATAWLLIPIGIAVILFPNVIAL
jgi:RsiW-degrading membrane proteinase PrsW (M82 family)